jgi:hypothetical protein
MQKRLPTSIDTTAFITAITITNPTTRDTPLPLIAQPILEISKQENTRQ